MSQKILAVDDEPEFLDFLKMRLEASGYDVITAPDGLKGLELAKKEVPDLIILDVAMPHMDGYNVCRMLKYDSRYDSIPIILLTALGSASDKIVGEEVHADAYLCKPVKPEDLLAKVKALLEP